MTEQPTVYLPSIAYKIPEEDKIMRVLLRSKRGGEHSLYGFEIAERSHVAHASRVLRDLVALGKVVLTAKDCPFARANESRPSWRAK